MDPRLAIAMEALATSNQTLGAEAARSQNVITRQYAMAALAGSAVAAQRITTSGALRVLTSGSQRVLT